MSGVDVLLVVEGDGGTFENVTLFGPANLASVYVMNSNGAKFKNVSAYNVRPDFKGVGRNQPCPCGSGKKFKRCHGAPHMGTGFISDNSEATFTDAVAVVDSGGTGFHSRNGDKSHFIRPKAFVGPVVDIEALIAKLNLPDDVPREHVQEAVELVAKSSDEEPLRYSKLKVWLLERDLGAKFVAETIVALTTAVIGAIGG